MGNKIFKYAHKVGKNWQKAQFARTNLKTLHKVSLILRRRTTVRGWHLEPLGSHDSYQFLGLGC